MTRRLVTFLMVFGLLASAAACGNDDADSVADSPTTTASPGTTESDPDGSETPDEPTDAGPDDGICPSITSVSIRNSDGLDGPIEPVTVFADVTFDQSAEIVIASYVIEADPQFGLSAPVGSPDAPEGETIFQVRLFAGVDQILSEVDHPENPDADTRINFISLYNGSDRILPLGTHTVTLTSITDDHLCGTITGETDPNVLQSFPVVEGRFIAERV